MKTKAHLMIPREILEEVDQIAGKRKRSLSIAQTAREKLQQERFLRTLEGTQRAWGRTFEFSGWTILEQASSGAPQK